MYWMGSLGLFFSLLFVVLLMRNDDSDPLMKLFKVIYRKICGCRSASIVRYVGRFLVPRVYPFNHLQFVLQSQR